MKIEGFWFIEQLNALGNTENYLWVETETSEIPTDGQFRWLPSVQGALRFGRERDALSFIWAMRRLQQALPYRDVFGGLVSADERLRVAEHIWPFSNP
jgi:hypothetical protein